MTWSTKKMTRCGTCSFFSKANWRSKGKLNSKMLFWASLWEEHWWSASSWKINISGSQLGSSEGSKWTWAPSFRETSHQKLLYSPWSRDPFCHLSVSHNTASSESELGWRGPWWDPAIHSPHQQRVNYKILQCFQVALETSSRRDSHLLQAPCFELHQLLPALPHLQWPFLGLTLGSFSVILSRMNKQIRALS